MLSIKFPLVKRENADVSFLLDISDKRELETVANIKEYLEPLLESNQVRVQNYYNMMATRAKASDAKKPMNCVTYGDSSICAKSSRKN